MLYFFWYFDFILPFQITTFFVNSLFIKVTRMFKLPNFKNMTVFQRLIDDLEGLKSTKLYENSFKAIDDCIHLLYSRKNYFEKLEFQHTIRNAPKDENRCIYGTDFDEKRMCSRCGNYHF